MSFTCLDATRNTTCEGAVELRAVDPLQRGYPRCEAHFHLHLEYIAEVNKRFPPLAPADFDASYAGESWDEDY
jgi:hypothetical protein